MLNMNVELIFLTCLMYVHCITNETELKIDYYEALIKNAINQAKNYKVRKDNGDFFEKTPDTEPSNSNVASIDYGTFDFIVVGAGSSGSVVASRLSENNKLKVLLLEAGSLNNDLTEIPYMQNIFSLTDKNWGYFTTPQKNGCYGFEGNKCAYYQGKVVGGSGTVNGLGYTRGNKVDYDNWKTLGNPGWSFTDVLRYFKKLENFESDQLDPNYRGFAGPVNVAYINLEQNFTAVTDAYAEIGVPVTRDYNAQRQLGVSLMQRNTAFGRRVSGYTAYVEPSSRRYNLNLTLEALVTRVLILQGTKTAYGVEFVKHGKLYIAKAKREIILSGGAINSPQLLLLSGIGPEDELKKHNIPVIVKSPVGKHFKEHYSFGIYFRTNVIAKGLSLREAIREYLGGEGILTNLGNSISFSYHNTRNASSSGSNIELVFYLPSPLCLSIPSLSNLTRNAQDYTNQLDICNNVYIDMYLLHPKSSGTLKLQSKSPRDFPLIDIGIFNDPDDLQVLYEGIQIIDKLGKTKFAKENGWKQIKFEFCNRFDFGTKNYWFCALKHLAAPGLHPASTVKMGPQSDPFAVVDQRLRVYGIKKLRVADCGVMATPISGHNNAVAFMIGEKAADFIKQDYRFLF